MMMMIYYLTGFEFVAFSLAWFLEVGPKVNDGNSPFK